MTPTIKISRHAVDRYRERVKPALGAGQAAAELEALVVYGGATPTTEAPDYCPASALDGTKATAFLEVADGICLPLVYQQRAGYLFAMTVITRGSLSEESRARRNERRAARRRKQAERRRRAERRERGVG